MRVSSLYQGIATLVAATGTISLIALGKQDKQYLCQVAREMFVREQPINATLINAI